MRYCTRCILPDSRPGIVLDEEGVCSACRGHDDKETKIDWADRAKAFQAVVDEAKALSGGYDCIVPVSGGKDSWYQVIRCQEYGLKVLGVTWRTPARTAIGQRNLDNMVKQLGIDHIDYSISPEVERKFTKAAFVHKGATAIPMHMAMFAISTRLAVDFGIPLVVWGENPQLEFGGPEADRLATDLNLDWIRRYGVSNNTAIDDWVGKEGLTSEDLVAYRLPSEDRFTKKTRSIFLGSYFKWNSFENAAIAAKYGFNQAEQPRTGRWTFADIDCEFISLHHLLKWYKFGITRDFDNLSVQVRYGMISREEAIDQMRGGKLQAPDADIEAFCRFVGEPVSWFWEVAESFRNESVWSKAGDVWTIKDFLVEDWQW